MPSGLTGRHILVRILQLHNMLGKLGTSYNPLVKNNLLIFICLYNRRL